MSLHSTYPALADLKARAKRRVPHFVWEYLDSGTGDERTKARNRAALDQIGFLPSVLHGEITPDTQTTFLGRKYPLPVGMAPIGMSGLIWPDAETRLARAAAKAGLPYCQSTVASQSPEDLAPLIDDGAWFQLYPPRDETIRLDMLKRVRDAGFSTLVLTVDVPMASRRERQTRSGLTSPPVLTPRLLAQVMMRPAWALGMLGKDLPRMRTLDPYIDATHKGLPPTAHVGYLLRASPDWDYVKWLRDHWNGSLIIKGILRAEDVSKLEAAGVDAIWVSNHAGRQFDGAPGAIEQLPAVRTATRLPLIFDSGIESGLDVLRALAQGADFVMLGRAWHFALAALGDSGPAHLTEILQLDMVANMGQLGAANLNGIPNTIPISSQI